VPLVLAHPHEDGPPALEALADGIGAWMPPSLDNTATHHHDRQPDAVEAVLNHVIACRTATEADQLDHDIRTQRHVQRMRSPSVIP
jgi:hypothetical protein